MAKAVKCPKCKKKKIQLIEHLVTPEVYYQNSRGVITGDTGGSGLCYYIKVECTCLSCGHKWRSRKSIYETGDKVSYIPSYIGLDDERFSEWLDGKIQWWGEEDK